MRVAVIGRKRSGKDTLVDYLEEKLQRKNIKVERLAFGDSLKEFAHEIYFDYPTNKKARELYQFMNVMREFDKDVWVKHLDKKLKNSELQNFIITDIRQQNELDYALSQDFMIIKVEADKDIRKQRTLEAGEEWNEEHENHPSEAQIDELVAGLTIHNNGTLEELFEVVDSVFGLISN